MPIISGGGGGAAFNGGTITQPLTINAPITGTELSVQGTHTDFVLDGFGDVTLNGDAGVTAQLAAQGVGNSVSFSLSGTDGGSASINTSGGLAVSDAGAATLNYGTSGFMFGGLNVAPNDATLTAGKCALWFDQSNGASKLRLRAKQADGTAVDPGLYGRDLTTAPATPATATLSSGAGSQLSTAADVHSYTPVTFNPTAGAAATCAVAISKDGTNYVALWTETEPAGIAFDGTIHGINVYVPAGWKLKLTVTNATIGTTTYY